jgi:hypothetical protein
MATALEFIERLDLPDVTASRALGASEVELPGIPETGPALGVAAASLVSFDSSVSAQQRRDVLDSTLLAQLAASLRFDRDREAGMWHSYYVEVLTNIGWVIQSSQNRTYQAADREVSLEKAILELLASVITQVERMILEAALTAIRGLPAADGRVQLFENSSRTDRGGAFSVGVCRSEIDGPALAFGLFTFESSERAVRVLTFGFSSSSLTLGVQTGRLALNEAIYRGIQSAVSDRLAGHSAFFLSGLKIDALPPWAQE